MRASSQTRRFTPTPLALAAAITLALSAGHVQQAHAQGAAPAATAAPVSINIPSQPLGQALNELARQANLQMSFPAASVAGKTAPAVSGQMTAQQALDRLLAGSGLTAGIEGGAAVVRPVPASPTSETMLPAVRVTAASSDSSLDYLRKKAEAGALGERSVLDTPFSVAVVSNENVVERGARSIAQIFANDPAVYSPTSSFTTDWWGTQIRGLQVRNYYVDDIPMMLYWGGDFPIEVTDSVTALKGLTGFMYGFGEPGGALSYQLKRPKEVNETTLQLGYRNPSLLSAGVDTSYRLNDDAALRANLVVEKGTAYNESEIERTVASLSYDQNFGASVKWFTTLVYEDSKTEAEPLQFYFNSYDVAGSGGVLPAVTYDYGNVNVDDGYYGAKTALVSTGVLWQIDPQWKLKTQLGFSRKDHESNKAFANLNNREGDYTGYSYHFANQLDSLFAQTVLQGTFSLAGMKHEIVGGLGTQVSKERATDYNWEQTFSGSLYQEQTFRMPRPREYALGPVSAETRQKYGFLSDTLHFNDHWQAIVGLRYTDYHLKDMDGDPTVDSAYKTSRTSPTLALIYKPVASTSLYGSYVEGLQPGSRVGAPYANAGEVLGATVSKQYELGVKHTSARADYTAALFRVQRANEMDEWRGSDRYLTQDGEVVYQGLELSGDYRITPALNVGLGAVYLDASIEKVSDPLLEGNTPAYAPKWQAVANVQYRVPALEGLKLQGNVRYHGTAYAADENTLQVPDQTIFNAGFSYDFRAQGQDLTLIGNIYNLFNKKYWAGGGWGSGNLGEARNVSLSLMARF
ncbi:MAG: TonB-dependent receptor [Moraxellaceae bacterium]|nr:TonB-dependent receptor [Moraxellaceae bacterium]